MFEPKGPWSPRVATLPRLHQKKRMSLKALFIAAAITAPFSIISGIETWNATAQSYPLQGLIEDNSITSLGDFVMTIGAGPVESLWLGSGQHFRALGYDPSYCVAGSIQRPITTTLRNQFGAGAADLYRVTDMFLGLPGSMIASAAHGIYMGVGEAVTNGKLNNLNTCGFVNNRVQGFDPNQPS